MHLCRCVCIYVGRIACMGSICVYLCVCAWYRCTRTSICLYVCKYVCMCGWEDAHVCMYDTDKSVRTHIHTDMHACTSTCMYVAYQQFKVYIYIDIQMKMYIYTYTNIFLRALIHICICNHTYRSQFEIYINMREYMCTCRHMQTWRYACMDANEHTCEHIYMDIDALNMHTHIPPNN